MGQGVSCQALRDVYTRGEGIATRPLAHPEDRFLKLFSRREQLCKF